MDPISFEYRYEDSDFDAIAGYMAKRIFRKRMWTLILFPILLAVMFALWLATGTYGFFAGFMLGAFFVTLTSLLKYKNLSKKTWKANPQTLETLRVTLSVDAVAYTSATAGSKRLWANFQSYAELPEYFLLFQAENPMLWLPKRHYADKVNEVRVLISSKLTQKA